MRTGQRRQALKLVVAVSISDDIAIPDYAHRRKYGRDYLKEERGGVGGGCHKKKKTQPMRTLSAKQTTLHLHTARSRQNRVRAGTDDRQVWQTDSVDRTSSRLSLFNRALQCMRTGSDSAIWFSYSVSVSLANERTAVECVRARVSARVRV